MSRPDEAPLDPALPRVRDLGTVPVYNCHVYLSASPDTGLITARGAALPEVQATGGTDREALQSVVRAFKLAITRYTAAGQAIPWVDPPLPLAPGERPRWVPVHF
jgi:hypothetical protein